MPSGGLFVGVSSEVIQGGNLLEMTFFMLGIVCMSQIGWQ